VPGSGANPSAAATSDAARLIQRILTSPRPGGPPPGVGGSTAPGGPVIGGGIAGVASTVEQDSIMIYEQHQKYNEWEFIYDMSKDRTNAGARGGGKAPGNPMGQPQPAGTSGAPLQPSPSGMNQSSPR
jgi:hypothetical protein